MTRAFDKDDFRRSERPLRVAASDEAAGDLGMIRRRRFRAVPLRIILPNLVTLLALSLGLTGIRFAAEGQFQIAVLAIIAAAILDGLDGRIARALRGTSRFGAELDSLADFVDFGVAPALHPLFLESARDQKLRLVCRARLRDRLRAAPGAIQCHDRRPEAKPAWHGAFLHRHAGAGRRDRRPAAALSELLGLGVPRRALRSCRSKSPMCCSSPF